jgi:hypothetical protein
VNRDEINEAAWSILDRANGKGRRVRKKKLTERQREFENFRRREAAAKERKLVGSRGAAGPCIRIDPKTGEVIGVVKKSSRRANVNDATHFSRAQFCDC